MGPEQHCYWYFDSKLKGAQGFPQHLTMLQSSRATCDWHHLQIYLRLGAGFSAQRTGD